MKKNVLLAAFVFLAVSNVSVVFGGDTNSNSGTPTEQSGKPTTSGKSSYTLVTVDDVKAFVNGLSKRDYVMFASGAATTAVLYYIISSAFADEDKEFDFE